ncbi:MAG: hypothetical protein K8R46_08220, partial [Pirellulales bacterium]|nr:hypothetical protein [Pirellulales bacterium]
MSAMVVRKRFWWRVAAVAVVALASYPCWAVSAESARQPLVLEAAFGKAEIDADHPAMIGLFLRGPDGLDSRSLLARQPVHAYPMYRGKGVPAWARDGYTYVVGEDGSRFESRRTRPERVEVDGESGHTVLRLSGIKLSAGKNLPPAAVEDWTLSAPGDGSQLVWRIVRRWKQDFVGTLSGSPALFFGFDARRSQNSVTSTIWYDPLRIAARYDDRYRVVIHAPARISENRVQTIRDRDARAIYKLWTTWQAPADLRLEVQGGYLYRRGSFAFMSEAGAVTTPDAVQSRRAGQVEEITLKIGSADKYATGYQLAVSLPDKETERSLRDFYASVFNGGAINDQKSFDFGNETDGYAYAGSSWMYGMALSAGTPAPGKTSSHHYDAAQAFRGHLEHILCTMDEQGRTHFGYNESGDFVDDNLHTIIGTRMYLLHSGDLAFAREYLPTMERMLGYFINRRNEQGLFKLAAAGAHWYYDCVPTSGVNGYYNAFLFKAAGDLAEMEEAVGRLEQAQRYRGLADSVKTAFNRVLWKEDAQGGPRYIDWIDSQGKEVSYFCDLCQWPAIAVGIASPEQARKIVATADARIAQLEKEYDYRGYAGLSALWPVPEHLNKNPDAWPFGYYMNGGSLLAQTYWEIMARARAGDARGAARRLRLFARHAAETGWAGNNSADIRGTSAYPKNDSGEPYLADMVCVTAAAVHGLLGIQPTWERLVVTPCLPADWPRAEADVLYKGRRHRVVIEGEKVLVRPLEQVIAPPLCWLMDFNLRKTAAGEARTANVEFAGHYFDRFQLVAGATSGTYESPAHDWFQPATL